MTVLGFGLQMGVQLGGTLIGGLKKNISFHIYFMYMHVVWLLDLHL